MFWCRKCIGKICKWNLVFDVKLKIMLLFWELVCMKKIVVFIDLEKNKDILNDYVKVLIFKFLKCFY